MENEAIRSITQQYRKSIWNNLTKGIREFKLVEPNDRIMVCISGGKDSMLLAACLEKYRQIGEVPFSLSFVCIDPGYEAAHIAQIQENSAKLEIPVEFVEKRIFGAVSDMGSNPCFMCARLRRGSLYEAAQARGCNKIALGHHFDDVIETILMGMLYGGQLQTMMPRLRSENYAGVEVIRPLYYVRESAIIAWMQEHDLTFLRCACSVTKEDTQKTSKRQEIKELIQSLQTVNPDIAHHIFRSVWRVDLRHLISYHDGETEHHFMEDYE